jgi:hypothetical protein
MPDSRGKLVVAVITKNEARIWAMGIEPGDKPEHISALDDQSKHHHLREIHHHKSPGLDYWDMEYFAAISNSLKGAGEILLISHGHGKANSLLEFVQYLERKAPDTAEHVAGAIDSNLYALSEPEILALSREWFETHREFV